MYIKAEVAVEALHDREHARVQRRDRRQAMLLLHAVPHVLHHRPCQPPGDGGQQRRVVAQPHRHRARERQHPLPITGRATGLPLDSLKRAQEMLPARPDASTAVILANTAGNLQFAVELAEFDAGAWLAYSRPGQSRDPIVGSAGSAGSAAACTIAAGRWALEVERTGLVD